MFVKIHEDYESLSASILHAVNHFNIDGKEIYGGSRNTLKIFKVESSTNLILNIKSFKIPNFINQLIYRYIRKSKAARSYKYGMELKRLGFNTPTPIAYLEERTFFTLKRSYFVCQHLNYDFTIREVINQPHLKDYVYIVKLFTKFTFDLHENGIEFLDHSPGNTLICKSDDGYQFYLVDLNRMNLNKKMSFDDKMKNFSRVVSNDDFRVLVSKEYAKLSGLDEKKVYEKMTQESVKFRASFHNKKKIKSFFKK